MRRNQKSLRGISYLPDQTADFFCVRPDYIGHPGTQSSVKHRATITENRDVLS